jgi:protein gp37
VEDQRVLGRIDDLREVPASVRFLSCEPLLGPMHDVELDGMAWLIVGGESGPGARAMKSEWVESILTQCRPAKVAFFKQWGGTRKSVTGRELNGRTYDELPVVFAGGRVSYKENGGRERVMSPFCSRLRNP